MTRITLAAPRRADPCTGHDAPPPRCRGRRWLGAPPPADLVLRGPARDGAIHEHDDPRLRVSGLATLEGAGGSFDFATALDPSTSTHGFSQADVTATAGSTSAGLDPSGADPRGARARRRARPAAPQPRRRAHSRGRGGLRGASLRQQLAREIRTLRSREQRDLEISVTK